MEGEKEVHMEVGKEVDIEGGKEVDIAQPNPTQATLGHPSDYIGGSYTM